MPFARISSDLEMHYLIDDYTDPWCKPETVLLLHGNAESSDAWYAWVPHLARRYRVLRPDLRGFGRSTPMAKDYPWDPDVLVEDLTQLLRLLDIERVHLVGAKLGGMIARHFAAERPKRASSLTLIAAPAPRRSKQGPHAASPDEVEKHGVEHWARRTMVGRLGSAFPKEGVEWWIKMMARTPVSTQVGFAPALARKDTSPDLPRVQCPTLVIVTEGSSPAALDETREWQERIQRSRLLVFKGDSFHAAASHADDCARAVLDFIAAPVSQSVENPEEQSS
jgi:3-oxoadipate enol-lactonase